MGQHGRTAALERAGVNRVPSTVIVLDTSVVLKWFRRDEEGVEKALALRGAYLDGALGIAVPDLLLYELGNVLRYKPDLDGNKVTAAVESVLAMGLSWHAVAQKRLIRAVEIAFAYDVTVYDAVFVALAEELQADFITADEQLVRRLSGMDRVCMLREIVPPSPPRAA